jgi:hydroxymethylpyrimidine pyrophosphatase-like HAD family hydrolase
MNGSENILRQIRMLVTDADGTLLGQKPEFELFRAFRARINDLRQGQGAVWVVCTGRGLRSYNRISRPMRVFGIEPDFVIARHAFIYQRSRWGYVPHWLWNVRVVWMQRRDELQVRRALPLIRRAVLSRNPFAHVVFRNHQRICFRFDDEGAANFGAEIIREAVRPYKYLQVFQYPDEVDVRTVPFTKGLAVAELARRLGIGTSRILAIGDGHNDISMMGLKNFCRTACPGNAVPEVMEAVHLAGGHIATKRNLSGVMEILEAYETGTLRSDLPPGLHELREEGNPVKVAGRSSSSGGRVTGLLLFLGVVYTTIMVLANFGLLGKAGPVIMGPYQKLVAVVEQVIARFLR